jgi:hypothetical protein
LLSFLCSPNLKVASVAKGVDLKRDVVGVKSCVKSDLFITNPKATSFITCNLVTKQLAKIFISYKENQLKSDIFYFKNGKVYKEVAQTKYSTLTL